MDVWPQPVQGAGIIEARHNKKLAAIGKRYGAGSVPVTAARRHSGNASVVERGYERRYARVYRCVGLAV